MIVSWNWLGDYLPLEATAEAVAARLTMAGLNHEESKAVGDDVAIDLEVTSNRPDCLGHLGIAREIAVLFNQPLHMPAAKLSANSGASGPPIESSVKIDLEANDLCPRYTTRLIRGVKVGPSPDWLAKRMEAIGVATVNNIVDITNYVLFECGQPLHAFDFASIANGNILVRRAKPGEKLTAIDHREYELSGEMCVIADGKKAIALAGVMGGAATEVTTSTVDVLIEAAEFDPLGVRATARKLSLHSDSSYRFERGVDSEGVDWASRRCCELILQVAGGTLALGAIDVGRRPAKRPPIVLRFAQLKRIIGIDFDREEVRRVLAALGCELAASSEHELTVAPPSWRRDLSREIDLIEEVARIRGYDDVPENVGVPMAPSHRSEAEQIVSRVRQALTSSGYDEALTASVVPADWPEDYSPWTSPDDTAGPLIANTPLLRGADRLRRALAPSLLAARKTNEALGAGDTWLFEIAKVYLPQPKTLPREPWTIGLVAGGPVAGKDFYEVKGAIEAIVAAVRPDATIQVAPLSKTSSLLETRRSCQLAIACDTSGSEFFGVIGEVSPAGLKAFGLKTPAIAAEVSLDVLLRLGLAARLYSPPPAFPAIEQDLNFIVDEAIRWADLEGAVRGAGGPLLAGVLYRETFRDESKDGPNKKRLLLSIALRDREKTLTGEVAAEIRHAIVAACRDKVGAVLVG
jgi:phenylalanyl-tRNA synthetase beta chain